ncbi:MAG: sn-glycerol-1-phosphate dehydrogenase [Treponema sp.]|jgi:glycerol-1-phosphate dehydrogenase [NAD(P)+]|nr:sn-glycerol-1-phosphate dehydrogenase [Treponema sp.]
MGEKIPSIDECLAAATDTKCLVTGDGIIAEIPRIVERYFAGGPVFVVADNNTFKAAGRAALDALTASVPVAGTFIFQEEEIHAEYRYVEKLEEEFRKAEKSAGTKIVPVAAGSGTINDLVKRSASGLALPYLCVPTAASVDGYTAYGAALVDGGFKQTFPCPAPLAVAADSSVLAAAPPYLSSSGFGDLAGKIIAGSDWIIADRAFSLDGKGELAPGTRKIDDKAWAMVQLPLRDNLRRATAAARGDKDAVKTLFEGLGVTGFALQYMQDSRPVSGCEHMWSHVWEMENLRTARPVTHGHKVAMGLLAAAAFTECLFREKPALSTRRQSWPEREESVRAAFAGLEAAVPSVLKTAREKFIEDGTEKARLLEEGLLDIWDDIKEAVFRQLPPYTELYGLLENAGCPVKPAEIGLSKNRIIAAARSAQMIRVRFTVLDLAFETGVFEDVLKRMEESDEYL